MPALFISEYVEGSSNNKAIELYNPTGAAIDLGAEGYSIQMFFNGSTTAGLTINLVGVIPAGGTFVLAHSSANDAIKAVADQFNGAGWFNGDDAVVLRKGAAVLDVVGQIGLDPGTEWGAGLASTADNTLRRNPSITDGDANGGDTFDPAIQWQGQATDTFDGLGAHTVTGGATVFSINSVTQAEGDSGATAFTFAVTRSSGTGTATVDFAAANGSATVADGDYQALSGTVSFDVGETSKQVTVLVNGDTLVEGTETFTVNLSNPTVSVGTAALGQSAGAGTIQNDDVTVVTIASIQGAAHTSPRLGQQVSTEGIVTAVDNGGGSRGFWIQDPAGDGDDATSEAIFVSTGTTPPAVTVGQTVQVTGVVAEFGSGSALTTTQLAGPGLVVAVQNGGATSPLPDAVVLGVGGRMPPTSVIEDDGFASFDPATDGADFYESLEGMRVTVPNAQAVAATDSGSTWVVADGGLGATGLNDRGGITITPDDYNPERINVFVDTGVTPAVAPVNAVIGDSFGDVTGVIGYFGGNYEVIATSIGATPAGQPVARETTALAGDGSHLTVAAYNVQNLDPNDPDARFTRLAQDIVNHLGGPDIIGLEEIQDSNGGAPNPDNAGLSGQATADELIAAIVAAGGPAYVYVEVAPATTRTSGGELNGNIRQGYLYNPERVAYVEGSAELITGAAYDGSRKPLAAEFVFNGETITLIGLHSTSRLGSDPLFGAVQPAQNAGEADRIAQSQGVRDYVDGLLAANPAANIVVMGDFNGFQFETSLTLLEAGGALSNLSGLLAPEERYSYIFDGNAQQIDHLLASQSLMDGAQFDAVHLNTGQPEGVRGADHDPLLARLLVNTAPDAANDSYAAIEDRILVVGAADGVLANDADVNGDALTAVLQQGPGHGTLTLNADGSFSYAPAADYNGPDSFTYVAQDGLGGISALRTVSVFVGGGNGKDSLVGTALDDRIQGGNGADQLAGAGGADTLEGGNGPDVLDGGAGADRLLGGNGPDTFVFAGVFGHDAVGDFNGEDVIRLDDAQFADFGAVLLHAAQDGDDVVITLDGANSITLEGVLLASLKANDFLFV